jgi:hypothetical protein
MKAYGGVDIWTHLFLTSALAGFCFQKNRFFSKYKIRKINRLCKYFNYIMALQTYGSALVLFYKSKSFSEIIKFVTNSCTNKVRVVPLLKYQAIKI